MRQLAFLMQKVALGDQQDTVTFSHRLDRILRKGQKFDRVGQHIPPCFKDLGNNQGRHASIGDFDGGFDHRQHKPLNPKPVVTDVALFSFQKPFIQMIALGVVGQKVSESFLCQLEKAFVVPKRIVGIETDCLQFSCHSRILVPVPPFLWGRWDYITPLKPTNQSAALASMIDRPDQTRMMAGGPHDNEGDTGVVVETKPKTQRPPLYKVLLLNDDYTPMEFVVHVLERFFGMTHAQAFEVMLTVHKKGVAVVGVFSHEIAETKVGQVMDFARRHQHPLQCTMEKE